MRLRAVLRQAEYVGVIREEGLQTLLLFMLVKFTDHHIALRACLLRLISLEVFEEQILLLLIHAFLLARHLSIHVLRDLVLRRDRLLELWQ